MESWTERITEITYTSMVRFRTESSCFEQFTQQINWVSTEQFQAGVKSSAWSRMREMTSEKFTTKENEQILIEVKTQKLNSLVQTPRSCDPVSGNRLRELLQNFERLEKEIQFAKVCGDASFWKRVSIGMCYKTVADADDGFGKSNSSMQRENTPSCWVRFQNLCRNSRTTQ